MSAQKTCLWEKTQQGITSVPSTSNSFEILAQASEELPLNSKLSSVPISSYALPPLSSSSPSSLFPKDKNATPMENQKILMEKLMKWK